MSTQATLSEFIITLNNDLYKIHAKVGMCGHNGTKPSDMQWHVHKSLIKGNTSQDRSHKCKTFIEGSYNNAKL